MTTFSDFIIFDPDKGGLNYEEHDNALIYPLLS